MKLKNLLALFLAFALVLTACGQTNKTNEKETKKVETTKEGKAKLEPAKVVFWHAMNGKQEEALKEITKAYMDKNPDIKIELQNQLGYKELQEKITNTSSSPDNLPTMTQAYPDWMFNPIKDDLVEDLTEYTKSLADYNDILEGFRIGSMIDGKVYSMPFNKSTEVLWYNEDLFKELNLKVPTNLDELKEVSKKIYEAKKIPGLGFDSLSNYYTTFLNAEGVKYDDKFDPTSDASKKAVNYYLDGVKEGYFRIAGTDKYMSGPFGNQKAGMYIGSNAGESYVLQGAKGKFTPKVAKSPFPATIQQGTDVFIFKKATDAEKKAAFDYLAFLTNKDNQITWASKTGYIPVRESAVNDDKYKNSGSLIAPILGEATKNLYSNPLLSGANNAYRESGTVLEQLLADPAKADVDSTLKNFKTTLEGIWNQ